MKPHALRKGLWLVNLALVAAVIGLGVWFVMDVRPAVAGANKRDRKKRPKHLEELRGTYEKLRVSGLKWKPQAPVSDPEINATILRADYKKKNPTHWIFSGPPPPEDVKVEGPVDTGPPPPKGLDTLGKVSTVIINPPNSTILFKFAGGKSRAFGVGDFVMASSKDTGRFKITKILEPTSRVYEIHYDVYGKDPKKAERADVLKYDRSGSGEAYPDFLRPDDAALGPAAAAGTTTAGTTPPGSSAPGSSTPGTAAGGAGEPEDGKGIIAASTTRVEDLTMEDLKPVMLRNPRNSNERGIRFDNNTYRYLKSKNARKIAETVKTSVAKDKITGRVIGLRITGLSDDAPSSVFDIKKGDILVSINGEKVSSRADAVRLAEKLSDKNLVTVIIDRRGKQITYRVDPQDPKNRRELRYLDGFQQE